MSRDGIRRLFLYAGENVKTISCLLFEIRKILAYTLGIPKKIAVEMENGL